MAAPAYSVVLWEQGPGSYSIPNPQSPAVPDGYVWVVREVSITNSPPSGFGHGCPMFILQANGHVVWQTPFNATTVGVCYSTNDVRFVLEAGELLTLVTDAPDLYIRVSGYLLTA